MAWFFVVVFFIRNLMHSGRLHRRSLWLNVITANEISFDSVYFRSRNINRRFGCIPTIFPSIYLRGKEPGTLHIHFCRICVSSLEMTQRRFSSLCCCKFFTFSIDSFAFLNYPVFVVTFHSSPFKCFLLQPLEICAFNLCESTYCISEC